jgi:hypothetical protein
MPSVGKVTYKDSNISTVFSRKSRERSAEGMQAAEEKR